MTPTEKKRKLILSTFNSYNYSIGSWGEIIKIISRKYSENTVWQELISMDREHENLLNLEVKQEAQGYYFPLIFNGVDNWLTSRGEDYLQHVKWEKIKHTLAIIQNWAWPVITALFVYWLTHNSH